ncbi:15-hydroxyprostaglandin dehydrogenase [NAD(+)]-like [Mytilus galloprovincialis]|uniref:15-hydroxyprostaglandin dehydrogenase [NAD(+)]-like n=1 Tax=Mytilus galloprovincialis TaxID=29158 RepID=UPI003F7CBCA0
MASVVEAAIVTGAAQGIGKSIATSLLKQGYKIFIFDLDSNLGQATAKDLCQKFGESKATFIKCDVTDKEQFIGAFNEAVKTCGHISVMVNNAGIADEFNFEKCIAVNLIGVIQGCNLAIDHMRKDKGGKGGTIVNVASMAAVDAHFILPTYCATKSGSLQFTRAWSKNPKCMEYGLTFMCLCPGFVDTEMVRTGGPHCLNPNIFELAKSSGLLKLDTIEDAFLKLMNDKQNGSVLEVSIFRIEYLKQTSVMQVNNDKETS